MSDDSDDADADYKVGYGRPPKATQFKRGKSGNLLGRPPAPKTPSEVKMRVAMGKVTIRGKDGRTRKVSRLEAAELALFALGLSGSAQALKAFLKNARELEDDPKFKPPVDHKKDAEDLRDLMTLIFKVHKGEVPSGMTMQEAEHQFVKEMQEIRSDREQGEERKADPPLLETISHANDGDLEQPKDLSADATGQPQPEPQPAQETTKSISLQDLDPNIRVWPHRD